MISIGLPFYNSEKYLSYAILSVINQSYDDWELILVNDGSTDHSLKIATKYSELDNRIRILDDGDNMKLPYRLNQIISESKGKYIARMDADDIMHPERLQKQFNFLNENSNYDLVSTGVISIDDNNTVCGYRHVDKLYTDFNKIERAYPIVHPSILAKKSWYLRNKYNTSYPRCEDFELWCRAISNHDLKLAVLPDLLYYYREEGNLFADKLIKSYADGFKVYSEYKGSFDLQQYIKMKSKCLVVLTMDNLGILQKLASRRNKKNLSLSVKKHHQNIINKIGCMNIVITK